MTSSDAEQFFYAALEKQQQHALVEAAALYRKALQLAPDRPSILINLAVVLVGLQQYGEAEQICARLLQTNPEELEAFLILGACQSGLGRTREALATFDRAIAIAPTSANAWNSRGNTLSDLGQTEEALQSYEHALRIDPDNPDVLNNRGNALLAMRRYREALESYNLALQGRPDYVEALNNRGNALLSLDQPASALKTFSEAAKARPDYARAHWNESLCRLLLGDFTIGWDKYEWGWRDGQRGPKFSSDKPWWDGKTLNGTLLAWGEQGIGDQILFSSMLPELTQRMDSLLVAVNSRLVTLLRRSFPNLRIVPKDGELRKREHAAHISFGSLGQYLRGNLNDFPRERIAYLVADRQRTLAIRKRLPPEQLICGVSWLSKNNAYSEKKSIRLADLKPVIGLAGLQAVDLQYGDTTEDRLHLQNQCALQLTHFDDIDNFNDIDGLASLIDACDAVVTVSNTTAHLAGALGKPTFLLLPHGAGRHWYWHECCQPNPWYPAIRFFHQAADGTWNDAVAGIRLMLNDLAKTKKQQGI